MTHELELDSLYQFTTDEVSGPFVELSETRLPFRQSLGGLFGVSRDPRLTDNSCSDPGRSLAMVDDQALRQLVASRPAVVAARSAVSMAAENLRLANAMRRQTCKLGQCTACRLFNVVLGLQAQIDIPVVNTGKPLVDQRFAKLRLHATVTQLENGSTGRN